MGGPGPAGLDLETLRSFVVVADEQSLAHAAPLLSVAAAGLSRRIHELERQLGVELLVRSRHGIVLTPAGEQILGHARKILQAYGELMAAAHDVSARAGG
jgi:DNA-binding transcriptional LysR family regulator